MKMKFFSIFLVSAAFCKIEPFLQNPKNDALYNMFENISQALSKGNHLLTVVSDSLLKDNFDSAVFATSSNVPHVVASFVNDLRKFTLNSSSIVSLNSIASLKAFNERTVLPVSFSVSQQLVIYCQNLTFEDLMPIAIPKNVSAILQYEYYMIEEEKSIRLLTFVWSTQIGCRVA